MIKRLYRSERNKVIAGVLGGMGEYLDVDPVLLRLFYVAVTVFTAIFPGIVVYIFAIFIVPGRSHFTSHEASAGEGYDNPSATAQGPEPR